MNATTTPEQMFAAGRATANDWLAHNPATHKPMPAAVCRALRLTDMVIQYEAEPDFAALLAAWEHGFDSTLSASEARQPEDQAQAGVVPHLLFELQHADSIILAMLAAMTMQQKAKVHAQLEAASIAGEGMTRHHERRAVIEAAVADMAAPSGGTAPAAALSLMRAIDDVTMDIDGAADTAGALLDLAAQECTTTELHRAFCAVVAAGRYLDDIAVLTQKLRHLERAARQGGAA